MTDKVEVTRADREAAADIAQEGGLYPTPIIDDIREGRRDYLLIVQAFARHRLTSTDPLMGEVREVKGRLLGLIERQKDQRGDMMYRGEADPEIVEAAALLAKIEEPKG